MRDDLDKKSNMFSSEHFKKKLKHRIYPSDKKFEIQEEELTEFKEEHHDEFRKISSGIIQYEVLTTNSKHPSSADHFERKSQAKISPSEQSLEKK